MSHDHVIKWKYFARHWTFVRGIHRLPVNSPHKGHWCGPLMFSLICAWITSWINNRKAGDLRSHRLHYGVTVNRYKNSLCRSKNKRLVFAAKRTLGSRFNYIDNNVTKNRGPIPLDLDFILGPSKFNLQANVGHHGYSSTVVIILLLSIVVKKHSIAIVIQLRNVISVIHVTLQLHIYLV